jgi:hypothetical protein
MFGKYVCLKPLGHLCINKKRAMPTMYILCLKYVCIYTGPETTTPFKKQWRIKSVEKIHISIKNQHHRLFLQMILLVWTMKTFLAKSKAATNHIIPGFT